MFRKGERPDGALVREVCERAGRIAVTHEAVAGSGGKKHLLVELLRDGMTFNLMGVAPGPGADLPQARHRHGVADTLVEARKSALVLTPGSHLAGGANTLPVIRVMMDLASNLARELTAARALAWRPAANLVGVEVFCKAIDEWVAGGPFPTLGLTGLTAAPDGGLHSEGLAYFIGQELRIEPDLVEDRAMAMQLAVTMIGQLVYQGRMTVPQEVVAPSGMKLRMEPSINRRFVRVGRA